MKEIMPSPRAARVDLSKILENPYVGIKLAGYQEKKPYQFHLENTVDEKILLKKLRTALLSGQKKTVQVEVSNVDRALGTILGSEITKLHPEGLAEDTLTVRCLSLIHI